MQKPRDTCKLQKAVIEIINQEPGEIQLTEAGAKKIPGISTQGISAENSEWNNSKEEKIRFPVQFNPAELQISAEGAADSRECIGDAAGSGNALRPYRLSPRIRVNFKLIFDGTNDDKPLVKQQVEGLLAALRNKYTRKVSLIWGTLSYSGYLNTVQASYVMFHAKGSPLRAEVQVGILCMEESYGRRR